MHLCRLLLWDFSIRAAALRVRRLRVAHPPGRHRKEPEREEEDDNVPKGVASYRQILTMAKRAQQVVRRTPTD
jgi:hypothetical protein